MGPSEAFFMAAQICTYVASLFSSTVRSTTDTSEVGTRNAMPVSFLLSSGSTLPTALAAPVEDGMMFSRMPRPPRQSLVDGPSTVFCVAVAACTVVIRPRLMPKLSCSTLATGARQLVVQEAAETMASPAYLVWFTPYTNIGVSSLDGADCTTFLAPAARCFSQVSLVRNRPVDSITMSAPISFHLGSAGSFTAVSRIFLPLTIMLLPSTLMSPWKRPCTESYFSMYAR